MRPGPGATGKPRRQGAVDGAAVDGFTREESRRLREEERTVPVGPPECPRCGSTIAPHPVEPRGDVAYVRRRVILVCSRCGRRAVVDRAPGRPRPGSAGE